MKKCLVPHTRHLACPRCTIIPPHMLKNIAQHGNAKERLLAINSLATTERLRGHRDLLSAYRAPMAFAPLNAPKMRNVYTASQHSSLPGILARKEGEEPITDIIVNQAYDFSGIVHDFFSSVLNRNSIDANGLPLNSTVHYREFESEPYDNAFWDGQQMVYGDGDGELFLEFTRSLDVVAHELTHGVTQYEANLVYSDQPGALNESFSDVFGSVIKQWFLKQTVQQADWLIGAELLGPKVKGVALRSLKAPGTAYDDPLLGRDPQPKHMSHFVKTSNDSGGVHINSGIPNHAFYLVATALGGSSWEKAGKIWYDALANRLRSRATFQRAATATIHSARELFGAGGPEEKAVREAWAAVGVS